MHHVRHQEDQAVGRNAIAADLVVGDGVAHDEKGWRVEPQGLLNHVAGVGKIAQAVNGRQLSAQDAIYLVMEALLNLGMLREEIPGPGEGGNGMPGLLERGQARQ